MSKSVSSTLAHGYNYSLWMLGIPLDMTCSFSLLFPEAMPGKAGKRPVPWRWSCYPFRQDLDAYEGSPRVLLLSGQGGRESLAAPASPTVPSVSWEPEPLLTSVKPPRPT